MKQLILRAFGIRRDEAARVAWLVTLSLFIGIFCAFFLTAANALFLDRFEISFLPLAYIAAAAVGYLAVMLFSRLERVLRISSLLRVNLLLLLVVAGTLWLLTLLLGSAWIIFLIFIWVGPAFALIFLGYWGLATRLFDLRQGKRLFGLIGAGEEVSTIISLFSVPLLVRLWASPTHLLLLAFAGLAGCLIVVMIITVRFSTTLADEPGGQPESEKQRPQQRARLPELLRSRYFLLMAALMVLLTLAHYIVDFSFLAQVRTRFQGPEQIAQFLGVFFGAVKILELVMKVFVSGRLLSQFGLRVGLMVLPVVLGLCAGLALVIGSIGTAAATFFLLVALAKLVWVVMRTSAFLPSFRVLYQPVPSAERLSFQTHVDGTAKQLAMGLVGVALLVLSHTRAIGAMGLFSALVPILGLWLLVVVLVHRGYRARLMENLSSALGQAATASPVEALRERLRQAPHNLIENAAAVMARVDATAVIPLLVDVINSGGDRARIAALRYIEQLKAVGASDVVQRVAESEIESAEVRAAAEHTRRTLEEVLALADDPPRVRELAASQLAAHRNLAVSAIGFASDPKAHVSLTELLWDKDRDVRRAALVAAGRVGSQVYWHRIISELFSPRFANAATFALITIGEPVLNDIERVFGKADPPLQARMLQIYERIGTTRALSLLMGKLAFPDRDIRRKALLGLTRAGYQAAGEQVSIVENEIEGVIRDMAWCMAAVLDLADEPAVAAVKAALEQEISDGRRALFLLLSLLYDPRAISLVKSNLDSGRPEAVIYALEIMDLVVSPEIKPLILPVVEDLGRVQTLRRLDALAPRQQLEPRERLSAIINRDYHRIGLWTRGCAVAAIAEVTGAVVPDLIACLYHPTPMIQELAARSLQRLDAEGYRRSLGKLPQQIRERLESVIEPDSGDADWESRSVHGRVRLLRGVTAFAELEWSALISLAESAEERLLKEGQRLPTAKDPPDSVYVLLDGEMALAGASPGELRNPLEHHSLVAFGPGARPVEALRPSRVIRLNPIQLGEIAVEHLELIPALFQAGKLLFPEELAVREEPKEQWLETVELGVSI